MSPPNSEELGVFFNTLSTCSKTKPAILSIIPNFSTQYIPVIRNNTFPTPLQSLYDPKYLTLNYTDLLQVCDSTDIKVSQDMAKAVEEATIQQASSKLWYKFRAGRITASRMKQACHTNFAMPSQSLVKSICYPAAFKFISKATQWGCQHEATALDKYKSLHSYSHQNFALKSSGLVLNPDWPHLGASPDGVVECSCCGRGVVEIKCPFCNNAEDVENIASSGNCLVNTDGTLHLNKSHAYYYQVQTQMFICSVKYCDFCICTFPDTGPSIRIERVHPDKDFWKNCTEKSTLFFKVCVLPELVGKWYTKPKNPTSTIIPGPSHHNQQVLYCYCRQPEPEEGSSSSDMIACDNRQCSIEWFHTKCLKLDSIPKGKWFCPDCRTLPEFKRKKRKREE